MPKYKLTIEYDGTGFAGWQRQVEDPSIQASLIAAVKKFCGETVDVVGAGRTDAGVHATAQVAHIELSKEHDPFRIMQGLNFHLMSEETAPPTTNQITVVNAEAVEDNFHARFSATSRSYVYRIMNRRARLGLDIGRAWHVAEVLDVETMQEAANLLIGDHDFSSFRDSQCQAKSPVKTMEKLQVQRNGNEIRIYAHARSFLHHQVRIITGTLVLVGKGKWQVSDVQKALDAKERKAAGITAPPEGLYLIGVGY
ncbi:MAG: tRNA pseudouridine(38-40) synthase TruA [Rickettsiales bacterium]